MIKIIKKITRSLNTLIQDSQQKRHSLVGPAHLWKMKQDFQFNFLKQHGLNPVDRFLDIGCGTLRGGIPIIQYLNEKNYFGIEVRENVLAEGRKELAKYKLEYKKPNLIVFSDFAGLKFQTNFDVIFAFSVLIHMEDEIMEKCLKFVGENLSEKGVFYANVNVENHSDSNWQGFPIVFRSVEFYHKIALSNKLTMKLLGEIKNLGHVSGQDLADKQIMLEFKEA